MRILPVDNCTVDKLKDIIAIEDQLCPWPLSKQIVVLGGIIDSYFKWVHPWSRIMYKVNKRKYVICDWFHVARRKAYPAYSISELSFFVSDYIFGRDNFDGWYFKDGVRDWATVECYYPTLIEAFAHCYIKLLKVLEQDRKEEAIERYMEGEYNKDE